jgi:creatinine amidohydrolase
MLNHFFKLAALWCTAVCLSPLALAQGSVYVEELTTQEISQALKAGKTTVLIPIGGTEQNGPHMVLGKHNVRAKVLAGKIAAQLGNALVAPVLAYTPEGNIDPPTEHMGFAGTVSISSDAFKSVLFGAARSFQKHGFTDVVLLGDSGNYQKLLSQVADSFNRQAGKSPTRVHHLFAYYRAAQTTYVDALKAKGLTAVEIGTHAASADTSLAMAVDPTLVKPERFLDAMRLGKSGGTAGDPRASSAAIGQLGVDAVVKISVDTIKNVAAAPR